MNDLFRTEVIPSDEKHRLGKVLLIPPVTHWVYIAFVVVSLVMAVSILTFGRYTRRATIAGIIEPDAGVVKLYAPQSGVLKSVQVKEGSYVRSGQIMMSFSTDHIGTLGQSAEQTIGVALVDKIHQLTQELSATLQVQDIEQAGLQHALASQRLLLRELHDQMNVLAKRVESANITEARFEDLQRSGFVAEQLTQEKRDDQLEQQIRLQATQRELTSTQAEIDRLESQMAGAPSRREVAQSQLQHSIAAAQADLALQSSGHQWSLVAPCDGYVSSLEIGAGQTAVPNVPLVSIVPAGKQLQAKLYASSRSVGFLSIGQQVELRLDAFPYQRFGAITGEVVAVANTPLSPNEIAGETRLAITQAAGAPEPVYTVRVKLDSQSVIAYGKAQALHPGMQLDADVKLDTKHLYQWVLDPLYASRKQ